MTRDEKLAVISGNLRDAAGEENRISDILRGNLYELALVAAESGDQGSAVDVARLVIPNDSPRILAEFCRIYSKYYGEKQNQFPFHSMETADKPGTVAIPEIARLTDAVDALRKRGIGLAVEYGDSFASCAEDVQYGGCRYVLIPGYDPAEGRLRSFDKLRSRCGLKIHAEVYIPDGDGREYGYRLCGLGFSDKSMFLPDRILFTAETDCDPIGFLGGASVFDAEIISAEIEGKDSRSTVTAVLGIADSDNTLIGGLLMYLNAAADITIDGYYAEIHHKSKGF